MSRLQEKKQQTSVSTLPSSVGGTRIDPPLTLNRSEGLGTDCSLTLVGRTGLGRAARREQSRDSDRILSTTLVDQAQLVERPESRSL